MADRDARVLGRHLEGLEELQSVRAAMDEVDGDFPRCFAGVFAAIVAYSRVAQSIHALLLTDPDLAHEHRSMAAATGLGPQLPMTELADWLEERRRDGDVARDLDVAAAALMVCGTADYVATLEVAVAAPVATASYGGMSRAVGGLLTALGARDAVPALARD